MWIVVTLSCCRNTSTALATGSYPSSEVVGLGRGAPGTPGSLASSEFPVMFVHLHCREHIEMLPFFGLFFRTPTWWTISGPSGSTCMLGLLCTLSWRKGTTTPPCRGRTWCAAAWAVTTTPSCSRYLTQPSWTTSQYLLSLFLARSLALSNSAQPQHQLLAVECTRSYRHF